MRLLLTTICLLAAGCIGSIGDENQGGNGSNNGSNNVDPRPAKDIFKADVHPLVAKCSGAVCHDVTATSAAASKFYAADADASYTATVAAATLVGTFTSIAPIIQYVKAGHQGLNWSSDEESKIANWLAKETAERSGGGGSNQPPPFDPKALLATWSGCMTLENFNAANMTQAWATLGANNLMKCINCHNGGVAAFLISNDPAAFFAGISEQLAYMLKYFTVSNADRKVVVNVGAFKSANVITNHPTFNAETNAGMTALTKFYDSTMAKMMANTCDPPRLKE